jgi:type I restriction enzyme S subunit
VPWVSLNDTGQLRVVDYISETAFNINELGIANSSARMLPAGSVIFSRDATVGLCAIASRPMAVSQHFIAWICTEVVSPEFLLFLFRSMTQFLESLTTGATLKTIGMPEVRRLTIPVPPLDEQMAISEFVKKERKLLDCAVEKTTEQIELLSEYRSALITAAVTGQLDIREHEKKMEALA